MGSRFCGLPARGNLPLPPRELRLNGQSLTNPLPGTTRPDRPGAEADMDKLNELQSWWNDVPPETRAYVWDGGVAFAALVGGFVIGRMVARTLRGLNFDAAFDLSGGGPAGGPAG